MSPSPRTMLCCAPGTRDRTPQSRVVENVWFSTA